MAIRTALKPDREPEARELRKQVRRHKAPIGECVSCDRERAGGNDFHPSHDASEHCESGRHNHCSCDLCF